MQCHVLPKYRNARHLNVNKLTDPSYRWIFGPRIDLFCFVLSVWKTSDFNDTELKMSYILYDDVVSCNVYMFGHCRRL